MITEPDVSLTDYGLAIECALFTYVLYQHGNSQEPLRTWFMLFFGSVGVAAMAGGTVHGFFRDESRRGHAILWRTTLIAIGVGALAGWAIGANILFSPGVARLLSIIAAVEFAVYCLAVLCISQTFMLAMMNYLPATGFLCCALAVGYARSGERELLVGLAGLILTFVAAGVQQRRIGLHPVHFNHNALYHVIQAAALFLIFWSAWWLVRAQAKG